MKGLLEMPSKFSFIFILGLGAGLVITAAYFISYASTGRSIIEESRLLEYQEIEQLREQNPAEYTSRRWKTDSFYDSQLNINILQKEVGAWGAGILGILLIMLGVIDVRLYRRRYARHQKEILVILVEKHIDTLLSKRDNEVFAGENGNRNTDKWNFEKSLFIDNVLSKENTGRLIFSKDELSEMIDQIIDGTLK